jgi:hypothetical protein
MCRIMVTEEQLERIKANTEQVMRAVEEERKKSEARKSWIETRTCPHCGQCPSLPVWLTVFAIILLSGCGPECIKGHYETVDVPARSKVQMIPAGKIMVPITTRIPAHKEQAWVCDQYEVEKEPAAKK